MPHDNGNENESNRGEGRRITIITSTSQSATYDGGDTNTASQANPADVTVPVTLGK